MNIAALGNMVAQLHVHVIARHIGDAAWPAPVWGVGDAGAFDAAGLKDRMTALRGIL
jgi:diadenosine tetraphosphate (Ap4A) HIT family hydrolase